MFGRDEKVSHARLTAVQYIILGIFFVLAYGLWRLQVAQNDLYSSERRRQPLSRVIEKMRHATIVGALFQTGRFDADDTMLVGGVLADDCADDREEDVVAIGRRAEGAYV